jgi:hypothetical protein
MKTERNFWDYESCEVVTEQRLRAEYDELKATDNDFDDRHDTFESYVEACCSKNGSLQLLRRGPGQFNSDGGNDAGAVLQFVSLLEAYCGKETPGYDVKIIVDGYILEAYDHAALLQGLIDAVYDFAYEIG